MHIEMASEREIESEKRKLWRSVYALAVAHYGGSYYSGETRLRANSANLLAAHAVDDYEEFINPPVPVIDPPKKDLADSGSEETEV